LWDQFATQRFDRDPVDECALAVDLDNRKPFAMCRLELWVPGDVDLSIVDPLGIENLAGALTEVAALRRKENDS
jgi:hypothetical protein